MPKQKRLTVAEAKALAAGGKLNGSSTATTAQSLTTSVTLQPLNSSLCGRHKRTRRVNR